MTGADLEANLRQMIAVEKSREDVVAAFQRAQALEMSYTRGKT